MCHPMYCDSEAAIEERESNPITHDPMTTESKNFFLANNPTFDKCTKHIEIDCHDICHRVPNGFITTLHVGYSHQLADILIKG